MPVEIKELVIRAVVGRSGPDPGEGGGGDSPAAAAAAGASTEEIVQECVRQVLRILAKDKER
jgi:hypothetical protein